MIDVEFVDAAGEEWETTLEREFGQDWGIEFSGLIFDCVKTCRNACIFCFMRQLAPNMRNSLVLRDDDFRLSFLTGTFVTLTNLVQEDFDRIVEQNISPLRVSLHAIEPMVRRPLIGKHASVGVEWLERLLDAGIEIDAQVVLVPEVNDGEHLRATLDWAYSHPGIINVGIVPLGFTRFQDTFDHSFNDSDAARRVLDLVKPYQARALAERNAPWVYCADEFYRSAWGDAVLDKLPPAEFYGDFSMFEDGIGIIRANVDEFKKCAEGALAQSAEGSNDNEKIDSASPLEQLARTLNEQDVCLYYVCGESMQPYFSQLIEASPLRERFFALTVANDFFGGNVDVTGLLTAQDISKSIIRACDDLAKSATNKAIFVIPDVCFNDNGVTLDDKTIEDIKTLTGAKVYVVASSPLGYVPKIARLVEDCALRDM
jgi:putative radical SAM enzyme (TIGR03279 family)